MTKWNMNTGTVPDGVGADTNIEVEYRDGEVMQWTQSKDNNLKVYWRIDGMENDVIKWRFI